MKMYIGYTFRKEKHDSWVNSTLMYEFVYGVCMFVLRYLVLRQLIKAADPGFLVGMCQILEGRRPNLNIIYEK